MSGIQPAWVWNVVHTFTSWVNFGQITSYCLHFFIFYMKLLTIFTIYLINYLWLLIRLIQPTCGQYKKNSINARIINFLIVVSILDIWLECSSCWLRCSWAKINPMSLSKGEMPVEKITLILQYSLYAIVWNSAKFSRYKFSSFWSAIIQI